MEMAEAVYTKLLASAVQVEFLCGVFEETSSGSAGNIPLPEKFIAESGKLFAECLTIRLTGFHAFIA